MGSAPLLLGGLVGLLLRLRLRHGALHEDARVLEVVQLVDRQVPVVVFDVWVFVFFGGGGGC